MLRTFCTYIYALAGRGVEENINLVLQPQPLAYSYTKLCIFLFAIYCAIGSYMCVYIAEYDALVNAICGVEAVNV